MEGLKRDQALEMPRLVSAKDIEAAQRGDYFKSSVGTQQFHDIPAALPAAQALDSERIEDGLLPTVLFRSLYVNNRDKFVVFNPRIKKN